MKRSVKDFMASLSAGDARELGRLRSDRDEDAFAELERSRGRDLLAPLQAGEHQDVVAEERAAPDAAKSRPGLAVLARADDEHVIPFGPLAQGARGDRDGGH